MVVVGAIAGWMLVTAAQARRDLLAVRAELPAVTSALRAGDSDRASAALSRVQEHARRAARRTSDPIWWAAAHVPVLGRTPAQVRGVSGAVRELADDTLPAAVRLAERLEPARIHPGDRQVDVDAVAAAAPDAHRAAASCRAVLRRLRATPAHGVLATVDAARAALLLEVRRAASGLDAAQVATRVLPDLLGRAGPKRYFVAFQNNAEARATGGLVGSYAIVRADHGNLRLEHVGSARELPLSARPVVDLGPEYAARYAALGSTRDIRNSNASPHFPDAAVIWQAMWKQRTGQALDGAFAVDPVAASYVLRSTGDARLADGQVVTGAALVDLVERRSYADISDSTKRDDFQTAVAQAVFQRVVRIRTGQVHGLLVALARAAGEGRLLAYSSDPSVQQQLESTVVAGVLPAHTGPYAGLVVTNAAGTKLDYYLRRSLRYEASSCSGKRRISQVHTRLVNAAPDHGLPPYVTVRADAASAPPPPGTERLLVSLYATPGARLLSVTQDGVRLGAVTQTERGHPVFTVDVEIAPGQKVSLDFTLDEPTLPGAALVPVQPLVDSPEVSVRVPACG